jgi:hypothetical protein
MPPALTSPAVDMGAVVVEADISSNTLSQQEWQASLPSERRQLPKRAVVVVLLILWTFPPALLVSD